MSKITLFAFLCNLLLVISLVHGQKSLPSWGHKNSDKFRSNSIQFYKPHNNWISNFQDTFASQRSVAFDVNRGKAYIFDLYRTNLTFHEIDLLNGTQRVLQYAAPPPAMSPYYSNLVIDSNSNLFFALIGSDGTQTLVKADLKNAKNVLYQNVKHSGENILLSEDSNILVMYSYSQVMAFETKSLKQLWAVECNYEPFEILLVDTDLHVATRDNTIHKFDIQTGKLISRFTVPDYLSGVGIDNLSYSGLSGWLLMGMNVKDSAVVGIVNVDAQKAAMVEVLYGNAKKLTADTSNIISSVSQNGTTVNIFSALNAYTGFSGGYLGTVSSFEIQKDNSVHKLDIQETWQNKFSGYTVASAQPNREAVVLMDGSKYFVVSNKDVNGKVLKSASSKITGNGRRYVVSAGNNMIYAFSFTDNQVIMEAVNIA